MSEAIQITAFEHVGIRVSNQDRSIKFYQQLGFSQLLMLPEHNACEMTNDSGISINLIFNAEPKQNKAVNVLQDLPHKSAGITHVAFVIGCMDSFLAFCQTQHITVTEGPLAIGSRRLVCFIRDPDGTVLEFNELI